jgi:vancomycin resistance protein YoaR
MDKKRLVFLFFLLCLAWPGMRTVNAEDSSTPTAQTQAPSSSQGPFAGELTLGVDNYSEAITRETTVGWIRHKAELRLSPDYRSEIENTFYCPTSKIFCFLTLSASQRLHMRLDSETTVNEEEVQAYLEDLARRVNRDPENAKFAVDNGTVTTFSEAHDGIMLDIPKSVAMITEALLSSNQEAGALALPFDLKKPEADYGNINNLGISSLIGEGVSNFKGSPTNRIHNVKVGAARFNGVLIKPGEEFSFVKTLGEVDADHGYLPELVIKNNATEPEFGGGICQVSTTTFRAAINSGLKITARKNHAYPVSYYNPQGMDSTVYIPNPDLRFINNTPNYILIQTKIVGTILTFDFYGTDDGRKTTVDGPKITAKQPDGSMKATFTQHVADKDGNAIINDVFNSNYKSPYLFPHPGGPVLTVKPANWSDDQWKSYKQMLKDIAKASAKKH